MKVNRFKPYFLMIFVLGLHQICLSKTWNCRNNELEVSCTNRICENHNDFTPMDITISTSGGLSVCAYSNCWQGKGKVFSSRDFLTVLASDLKISTNPSKSPNESVSITLDRRDNVALLKFGAFAQPLNCVLQIP